MWSRPSVTASRPVALCPPPTGGNRPRHGKHLQRVEQARSTEVPSREEEPADTCAAAVVALGDVAELAGRVRAEDRELCQADVRRAPLSDRPRRAIERTRIG